jgi:transglutaminase-like putative cysteine protease
MIFGINHNITYHYSEAVYLEPHTLHLFPLLYSHVFCQNHQLKISPAPSAISQNTDAEGNRQHLVFFDQKTSSLHIESQLTLNNQALNPFGFVYFPFQASKLPMAYTATQKQLLAAYLSSAPMSIVLEQFARNIAALSNWKTTDYLVNLCKHINQTFQYQIREKGAAKNAEQTLLDRAGSCRDFAVLYIACCQIVGLAARFVSGYLYQQNSSIHQLHAWAEVYLPGAGWRGFDPTQNSPYSQKHIAIAASAFPSQINPVVGTYRGQASAQLSANVEITLLEQ